MRWATPRARIALFGLALCLLSACGTQPIRRVIGSQASGSYTVKAGDTLYSIAWRNGVDFHELAKLNHIGNDYKIYPGQVLTLSGAASKAKVDATRNAAGNIVTPAVSSAAPPRFILPTQGSYIATTRPNGGIGLVFNGRDGQEIRATAAGRVVYSGNGLLGYGQLLIIKHNEQYLSAYGHLRSAMVNEGDAVTAGQLIASMGNGPTGAPQLYFEIRVDGRPIDPVPLLSTSK